VVITQPINGITVSGQVLIEATASDAGGILSVAFAVDGDELGEDDTPPYSWDWNSTPYGDGETHSLLAAAEDRAGNIAISEYVVVRVQAH
jgi:large repetitive protein